MYVSTAVVRAVSGELQRDGVRVESILDGVGLSPSTLKDVTGRLSARDESRFVGEAMRVSGHDDLGLRVGDAAPTYALHVIGPLLQSVGSLRRAHQIFLRYGRWLSEGARYELFEANDGATFRYTNLLDAGELHRFYAELCLAFVYRVAKGIVGHESHAEVIRFAHPRPPYIETYAKVFDCPVEFDQAENEIVFDSSLLDLERLPADDSLLSLLQQRAEDLLSMLGAEIPLEARVRDLLRAEPDLTQLSLTTMASRLGIGEKTLQRRLADVGRSWSALVSTEQKQRAFEALAESPVSIKELAHRLGFSDSTTFHRAFKRWTGMTPAEYRARHRPGAASLDDED
jgi:AraC-like DNA-binding protein